MIKKITVVLLILFALAIWYLANQYTEVGQIKLIEQELPPYYEAAANNFLTYGLLICVVSLILVNITAITTKQLFWFAIPFTLTVVVGLVASYQAEDIFKFKRALGLGTGSFSASFMIAINVIVIDVIVISINFLTLKFIFKRKLS